MLSLVRIDNRLIHGQVVEAWIPHLHAERVVVADDEAAQSPLVRAAMTIAVKGVVDASIESLKSCDFSHLGEGPQRTLLLLRDVESLLAANARGLSATHVNLGNIHFATGRRQISPSVFISSTEVEALKALSLRGVRIEASAVPSDHPIELDELVKRFEKGA